MDEYAIGGLSLAAVAGHRIGHAQVITRTGDIG
jgi:hypothetical protein